MFLSLSSFLFCTVESPFFPREKSANCHISAVYLIASKKHFERDSRSVDSNVSRNDDYEIRDVRLVDDFAGFSNV